MKRPIKAVPYHVTGQPGEDWALRCREALKLAAADVLKHGRRGYSLARYQFVKDTERAVDSVVTALHLLEPK